MAWCGLMSRLLQLWELLKWLEVVILNCCCWAVEIRDVGGCRLKNLWQVRQFMGIFEALSDFFLINLRVFAVRAQFLKRFCGVEKCEVIEWRIYLNFGLLLQLIVILWQIRWKLSARLILSMINFIIIRKKHYFNLISTILNFLHFIALAIPL